MTPDKASVRNQRRGRNKAGEPQCSFIFKTIQIARTLRRLGTLVSGLLSDAIVQKSLIGLEPISLAQSREPLSFTDR